MSFRAFARRYIPYEVRLRIVLLRRWLNDRRAGVGFASGCGDSLHYPNQICSYSRLFVDYAGQEHLAAAKRANQAILASHLSGREISPGEVFSIWHLAPRPSTRAGYAPAAALKNRQLTSEVGGAICLLSTILYNVALLGGLEIKERHYHSVDSYGDARYFELGRDAAIEYGYLDLRFKNPHLFPVLLTIEVTEAGISAGLRSRAPHGFRVELEVDRPILLEAGERTLRDTNLPPGHRETRSLGIDGLQVHAKRRMLFADGSILVEQLEDSVHNPIPAVVALGSLGH